MKICPCCNGKKFKRIFKVVKFPYITTPIDTYIKKKISRDKKLNKYYDNLENLFCQKCTHIFLRKNPKQKIIDELYSRYYNYPSPLKDNFEPSRDNEFLNFFFKFCQKYKISKNKNIYEIGCFDGYILYKLKKNGFKNVEGCDPSLGALIGKKFGLKINREFFSKQKLLSKKKFFDVIIARHVLEHLKSPENFLRDLSDVSTEGSLVFLEVPNGEYYLKYGLSEVFSLQHIHLFTIKSIYFLLKKLNYNLIFFNNKNSNLYLVIQKNKPLKKIVFYNNNLFEKFKKNFLLNNKNINNILEKFSNKKICFWGAGGFACAAFYLYKIDKKNISFLIDSDKSKLGKEFIGINIPVLSPTEGLSLKPDLIVITSYYSNDIIRSIKKYDSLVKILTIYPKVKII